MSDRRYDAALDAHSNRWPALPEEAEARLCAERTALLLTASILLRHAPSAVADAFVATRLDEHRGMIAGAIGARDVGDILDRLG